MIAMVKVPRLSSVVPQTPRWRWVTGIVIFAVAYAVLLTAYFYDGRSGAFEGYTDKEPAPGGVLVTMEFDGIDPQTPGADGAPSTWISMLRCRTRTRRSPSWWRRRTPSR